MINGILSLSLGGLAGFVVNAYILYAIGGYLILAIICSFMNVYLFGFKGIFASILFWIQMLGGLLSGGIIFLYFLNFIGYILTDEYTKWYVDFDIATIIAIVVFIIGWLLMGVPKLWKGYYDNQIFESTPEPSDEEAKRLGKISQEKFEAWYEAEKAKDNATKIAELEDKKSKGLLGRAGLTQLKALKLKEEKIK